MDFLSTGEVAVRVRKKRLGVGADNNNTKMVCADCGYSLSSRVSAQWVTPVKISANSKNVIPNCDF